MWIEQTHTHIMRKSKLSFDFRFTRIKSATQNEHLLPQKQTQQQKQRKREIKVMNVGRKMVLNFVNHMISES